MEVPLFDDLYSFDEYSKNRELSKKEKLTSKQASSDVMDSRLKMLAGAGGGGSGTDLGSSKWTAIENHMLSHGLSTDALEPDAEEMVMNEELKKKRRSQRPQEVQRRKTSRASRATGRKRIGSTRPRSQEPSAPGIQVAVLCAQRLRKLCKVARPA